jgi:hypothetical protein
LSTQLARAARPPRDRARPAEPHTGGFRRASCVRALGDHSSPELGEDRHCCPLAVVRSAGESSASNAQSSGLRALHDAREIQQRARQTALFEDHQDGRIALSKLLRRGRQPGPRSDPAE